MPDFRISESGSVQFPMVKHAVEVGWTALTPDDAQARRGGIGGMLLRDALSSANPKDGYAIERGIKQLRRYEVETPELLADLAHKTRVLVQQSATHAGLGRLTRGVTFGLSPRAFAAFWLVKESPELKSGGIDPMEFAKEIERLVLQFPNSGASVDERRKLRSAMYRPLPALPAEGRTKLVDDVIETIHREGER
jgi:hypothetical protein